LASERDIEVEEPVYEPHYLQDLLPWERRWEETHRFEPEDMEQ